MIDTDYNNQDAINQVDSKSANSQVDTSVIQTQDKLIQNWDRLIQKRDKQKSPSFPLPLYLLGFQRVESILRPTPDLTKRYPHGGVYGTS